LDVGDIEQGTNETRAAIHIVKMHFAEAAEDRCVSRTAKRSWIDAP